VVSVGVIRVLTHCQQFTFYFNYCITIAMLSDACVGFLLLMFVPAVQDNL